MESTVIPKHLPTTITSPLTTGKGSKLKASSHTEQQLPRPATVNASSATNNSGTTTTTGESNTIPSVAELMPFAQKCGHLKKLSGRNIWNVGTWRDRYCLLVKNKLYYFENEESQGTEKSAGFVNLDDFTTCSSPEVSTRLTKKVINVFVIGTNETKSFFESNRDYYFAADTLEQRNEWMAAINERMRHHQSVKSKESGASAPSPTEVKHRQKAQSSTPTAKRHEQETPTSHQRKTATVISNGNGNGSSSDAVHLSNMLKSPKAERSLSIFHDGSRKILKSGTSQGDNALTMTMSSLPSSPTEQQLDFSVTKGRAKGPPGRRLPRKSSPCKEASSSTSPSDLLQDESGTQDKNGNMDDQMAAVLSRSHRAKSLCLLDNAESGSRAGDNAQAPNSRLDNQPSSSNNSKELDDRLAGVECGRDDLEKPIDEDNNNSFERAWFLKLPSFPPTTEDESGETTSDYFSMHESSTNNSSTSSTPTHDLKPNAKNGAVHKSNANANSASSSNRSGVILLTYTSHTNSIDNSSGRTRTSSSTIEPAVAQDKNRDSVASSVNKQKTKWSFCSLL